MPRKVEAYVCKVCNVVFIGTLEQATKHEQTPIDDALPMGLVFLKTYMDPSLDSSFHVVLNDREFGYKGRPITLDQIRPIKLDEIDPDMNKSMHSWSQEIFEYDPEIDNFNSQEKIRRGSEPYIKSSYLVKKLIKNGDYKLLNDEQFDNFKKLYIEHLDRVRSFKELDPDQLLRTTPEIEELVAQPA